MDMKKVMALAMMSLMVIPSFTMVVRADLPDEDMASAIERAQTYLENVRTSAETLAGEYPGNDMMEGYLNDLYALLGQYEYEGPEYLLQSENGIAKRSDVESNSGTHSVHLKTIGTPGAGDEAKIVIPMPEGFTLDDLETISWTIYALAGYPAHVDIFLDNNYVLTAEQASNNPDYSHPPTGPYGGWLNTFDLVVADECDEVNDATILHVANLGAGPLDAPSSTLANWKAGTVDSDPDNEIGDDEISGSNVITRLEIEVDNWIKDAGNAEAYVDDIKIVDGATYDFEEEPEYLGAEGFLNRASECLGEGDFNSAARNLAAARNILGRVKGLLNRMAQAHKVTRIERFTEQVKHRIKGIVDKVERLRGRLSEGKANKAKSSMGLALGNMPQLGDNPTGNEVNAAIDELESTIERINAELVTLGVDISDTNILEAMDRLEVKIRVLNATAERLSRKGCDTTAIVDELNKADELLNEILASLTDGDIEEAESLLKQAGDLVSEASNNIRRISKEHQNKGSKGNGNG